MSHAERALTALTVGGIITIAIVYLWPEVKTEIIAAGIDLGKTLGVPEVTKYAQEAANDNDVDTLARTLYGEARYQDGGNGSDVYDDDLQAVANVVMNRYHSGKWFAGNTVAATCLKPWQFSCWNATDPNRMKLLAVNDDNAEFRKCKQVAGAAVAGSLPDITHGATSYHADYVSPVWADPSKVTVKIGRHIFYAGIN